MLTLNSGDSMPILPMLKVARSLLAEVGGKRRERTLPSRGTTQADIIIIKFNFVFYVRLSRIFLQFH